MPIEEVWRFQYSGVVKMFSYCGTIEGYLEEEWNMFYIKRDYCDDYRKLEI